MDQFNEVWKSAIKMVKEALEQMKREKVKRNWDVYPEEKFT